MNIGSMSTSMMPMRPTQQSSQQQTLSDEQKSTVNSILSNYDAESLTQENVETISKQLGEAGIAPSDSLQATIEEAGYDFSEFLSAREEANGQMQGGKAGMPPPPRDGENTAESDYSTELSELLSAYESGEADETDFESFISFMRSGNDDLIGNLLDTRG